MKKLAVFKLHSMVINDLMSDIKKEYQNFAKVHQAYSRGDYQAYLNACSEELAALGNASVEVRNAELQVANQLNIVQHRLEGLKKKLEPHKHAKPLIARIRHYLNVISDIERRIRSEANIAARQEAVVKDLTRH